MVKIILLLLILFFSLNLKSQDLKKSIQDNSHRIFINVNDTSYDDLLYLGEVVKNSKVVMLGEQEHGDGTTFIAKTRIVKFLHEKLGFNVLAFESDFISLNMSWSQVINNKLPVRNALYSNIYPVWTKCLQCDDLFKYIESESKKTTILNVAGFDNQLTGVTAYLNLKNLLLDSIAALDSAFYKVAGDNFSTQIDSIKNLLSGKIIIKALELERLYKSFISNLSILEDFFTQKYPASNRYLIFIKSIKSFYLQNFYSLQNKDFESGQERDSQMALNLTWLIQNQYPNDKIIVWAANSHIIKNYQADINKKYNSPFSMGQILTKKSEFSQKVYVIGFTGYTGKSKRAFGNQKVINISKPKKNSFEEWINETKKENVFIDFVNVRKTFKNEKFYMNFKNWIDEKSDWLNSYDGIIYINIISPCETKATPLR